MAELVLAALLVSLTLYSVLGGADFGAGAIEAWLGKRGALKVDVALSPVWEVNHIWLVLAAVLAMVGFPSAYTAVTTYLHVPLSLALLGIVARGTAFTFRHYDPNPRKDARHGYTAFFRYSSWLTPFFLGVVLAAAVSGRLRSDVSAGFYAVFVAPWLSLFCVATGLFVCVLFAFQAAGLLAAERASESRHERALPYLRLSRRLHVATVACGGLVFVTAILEDVPLVQGFFASPIARGCLVGATLWALVVAWAFHRGHVWGLRLSMAAQTLFVLGGFFAAQFPVFVRVEGADVVFPDAAAPAATLRQLSIALGVGVALIVPGIAYLVRVYKPTKRRTVRVGARTEGH